MQDEHTDAAAPANAMTIGELSQISGLSVSAIRFYQRRCLLPPRGGSGWQRFGHETLDRLAVIELAKAAGFSLDETSRFLDALDADPDSVPSEPPIWHGLAEHKLGDIDARIARLQQMRSLLRDALDYSYVSPDRAAQVPRALGWAGGGEDDTLPHPIRVPHTTETLHTTETPHTTETLHTTETAHTADTPQAG